MGERGDHRAPGWRIAGVMAVSAWLSIVPGQGFAEVSKDLVVRYLLAAVQAFRSVYVEQVTERMKPVGIEPKEDWATDDHAVMLPFQFVKAAGQEMKTLIKGVDIGLISLSPLYSANFPKTEAEVEALKRLTADPKQKVLTFGEGKEYKGIAADFAIEQSCVDCHNHHPNSVRHDFKKGDLMGAVVVRLRK